MGIDKRNPNGLDEKKETPAAPRISEAEQRRKNGKNVYIGDYVKPFKATIENVNIFNQGCKILADRLAILIKTKNVDLVPENPPAFGELTHVM